MRHLAQFGPGLYGEALGLLVDGHALIQQLGAQRVHDAAVAQAVEVQRRGGDDRAPQAAQHVEEKGHVLADSAHGEARVANDVAAVGLGGVFEDAVGVQKQGAVNFRAFEEERLRRVRGADLLVAIDVGHAQKHALRALVQIFEDDLHRIAADEIVAVHKEEVLAAGHAHAAVARGAEAAVFLVDDLDAQIRAAVGKFVAHAPAAVGGAVVHEYDLHARKGGLVGERAQAAPEVLFHIVYRHDDADRRGFSHGAWPS